MFDRAERRYLEAARLGRLATVDSSGQPHVVPVCFALVDEHVVTPIDEKPKTTTNLQRVRNLRENPHAGLVVDHWTEDWSQLGWVQLRGTASVVSPEARGHHRGVAALRDKYDQYEAHALEKQPAISLEPDRVVSWGTLETGES